LSQGQHNLFSEGQRAPEGGNLSCEQARRQIERLIEESDLKDFERTLLMAHVKACPACKAELECYRRAEMRVKEAFSNLDTAANFNERLMAALPAPGSAESPDWVKNVRAQSDAASNAITRRHSTRAVRGIARRSILRTYWLPISMSAVISMALLVTYYRTHGREGDAPPRVAFISGDAIRVRANGAESPLRQGDPLNASDIIRSGAAQVSLTLTSADRLIAVMSLAPNSKINAQNRHMYSVHAGAAYFQVSKDRPKNSPDEYFEVAAGDLATVRVTGTSFIVDLAPYAAPNAKTEPGALVSVEEGIVEVRTPAMGSTQQVVANKELLISATRSPELTDSDVKSRLARVRGSSVPAQVAEAGSTQTPGKTPVVAIPAVKIQPAAAQPFNWDVAVKNVPLAGKSLAEGIDVLAEILDNAAPLKELAAQVRAPAITNGSTLSFSVYSEMPLRSVLAWMARDVGWTFEPGADGRGAYFRTSSAADAPGAAGSGLLPDDMRSALDAPIPEPLAPAGSLPDVADQLSRRCGVTMVVQRGRWREKFDLEIKSGKVALAGQSVLHKLDALLGAAKLGCAWYDHVLYLGAPSTLELLTLAERHAPLSAQLIGQPAKKQSLNDLKELLIALKYPADNVPLAAIHLRLSRQFGDSTLAGKPVFSALMPPDADGLRFKSGLFGAAVVSATLNTLATESPSVPSVAGMLSQPFPPGPVADMETLLTQARSALGRVESNVRFPALSNQAFVFKNMTLGESLEWAVWVSGFGFRIENNVLLIDDAARCYGPASLQVLSLASLTEKRPELATDFPPLFGRMLTSLYPALFTGVEFRSVGGKLVFTGDLRQLQLAQRVRAALERALESNMPFNALTWLPPARQLLEANLKESFQGAEKLPAGTFAGLLRRSALTPQLRATVLVDPAAMKEHGSDAISELNVANASVGKVLEELAGRVGLKVAPEGDVIWLRPAH